MIDALGDHFESMDRQHSATSSPVKKVQKTVQKPGVIQDRAEAYLASLAAGVRWTNFKHLPDNDVKVLLKLFKLPHDDGQESKEELRKKLIVHVRAQLGKRLGSKPDVLNMKCAQLGLASPGPVKKNLAAVKDFGARIVQKARQSPTKESARPAEVLFPHNQRGLYCPRLEQEGNTCFANQILASMLSLSSVQHFVRQYGGKTSSVAMLQALSKLRPEETRSTMELRLAITRFNKMREQGGQPKNNYTDGRQQDAQEFLMDMLEFMWWDPIKQEEDSVLECELKQMFMMVDQGGFKCSSGNLNCQIQYPGHIAHFPVTQLAVRGNSLQEAYDEEDKYRDWPCPDCGYEECERVSLQTLSLPKVWIFQLKRFCLDGRIQKVSTKIDVPLVWEPCRDPRTVYTLKAVTIHKGETLDSGHYVGLTIDPSGNFAYLMNDAQEPKLVIGLSILMLLVYLASFSGPWQTEC